MRRSWPSTCTYARRFIPPQPPPLGAAESIRDDRRKHRLRERPGIGVPFGPAQPLRSARVSPAAFPGTSGVTRADEV